MPLWQGIKVMRNAQATVLAFMVGIGACGDAVPPVASGASVAEGVYSNEYFGLALPIPDGWFVASDESEQFLTEGVGSLVAGEDAALKAAVETSRKTTYKLLTLSEFEIGSAVDFNPNLILMAERVSHLPGIESGGDYLFHSNKLLLQSQLAYELVKEPYVALLGGREWYRTDFTLNALAIQIEQTHFALKVKDYVLLIILSAATKEQMDSLEQIADVIAI